MKRTKTEGEGGTEIVRLNVGGVLLECSMATLIDHYPDSVLAAMFRRKENIPKDGDGRFYTI